MKKDLKSIANYKYLESLIDIKNKRTVQFAYLTFTIIALIFFGIFAINPTLSTIAKLQKELSDNQFVDEQLQRKISNLSTLQSSYANIQNDLSVIDSAIPTNPQAPILIAQIQSIASSSNIAILSAQVLPVELGKQNSSQKYGSFSFTILGQGSQDNISQFISALSTMQRIISLDQITVTKKDDGTGNFQVSIRGSGIFKP